MTRNIIFKKTLTILSISLSCSPLALSSAFQDESGQEIHSLPSSGYSYDQELSRVEDLTTEQCDNAKIFLKNAHQSYYVARHNIDHSVLTFGRRTCYKATNLVDKNQELSLDLLSSLYGFAHLCLTPKFSTLISQNQAEYIKNVAVLCKALDKLNLATHTGTAALQTSLTLKYLNPLMEAQGTAISDERKTRWLSRLWKRLANCTSKSRTIPLLKAAIILDHEFCPPEMNQDEALSAGKLFLELAQTPQKSHISTLSLQSRDQSDPAILKIDSDCAKKIIEQLTLHIQNPQTVQETFAISEGFSDNQEGEASGHPDQNITTTDSFHMDSGNESDSIEFSANDFSPEIQEDQTSVNDNNMHVSINDSHLENTENPNDFTSSSASKRVNNLTKHKEEIASVLSDLYPDKVLPLFYAKKVQSRLKEKDISMDEKQITNFVYQHFRGFKGRKSIFYSDLEVSKLMKLVEKKTPYKEIASYLNHNFHNNENIRNINSVTQKVSAIRKARLLKNR